MAEYIIGDIYEIDGSPNWFCVPSLEDLDDEYERIVRCRDCEHMVPRGFRLYDDSNEAADTACMLYSDHDYDYDWTLFRYMPMNCFCHNGKRKQKEDLP